jgi:hypothetical protein
MRHCLARLGLPCRHQLRHPVAAHGARTASIANGAHEDGLRVLVAPEKRPRLAHTSIQATFANWANA